MTDARAGLGATTSGPLLAALDHHLAHRDPDRIGHGDDEYSDGAWEHPMAYGMYLRGLVALHQATGEDRYLAMAGRCADRLLELRAPGTPAWGLGFAWKADSPTAPYTITTALCAWGLLEHSLASPAPLARQAAHEALDWLARGIPWSVVGRGAAPWYSADQPYVLPNVAAAVAGVLTRAAAALGAGELKAPARAAAQFLEQAEVDAGCWPYGFAGTSLSGNVRPQHVVDLMHSGYVLDGLVAAEAALPTLAGAAARAAQFLRDHFIQADGSCIEKVVLVRRDDPATRELLQPRREQRVLPGGETIVVFPAETRLWGYGALLGAFARCEELGVASADELDPIIARLLSVHTAREDGRFAYLPERPVAFPRHESHLFEGLAAVVLALARRTGTAVGGRW